MYLSKVPHPTVFRIYWFVAPVMKRRNFLGTCLVTILFHTYLFRTFAIHATSYCSHSNYAQPKIFYSVSLVNSEGEKTYVACTATFDFTRSYRLFSGALCIIMLAQVWDWASHGLALHCTDAAASPFMYKQRYMAQKICSIDCASYCCTKPSRGVPCRHGKLGCFICKQSIHRFRFKF